MKKIVSLTLMIAFLFQFFVPTASYAIEEGSIPKEELGLLQALSLLPEEGLSEGPVLTRGEFCNLICNLFQYQNFKTDKMPFRDLDKTHPYYDSISALYAKGVIKGISKYVMAPNKTITLGEAAGIAVSALGYGALADTGVTTYYAQASDLRLFDNLGGGQEDGLTEEMAVRLMYNILFAPIMVYKADGEKISYNADSDNTMMGEIYHIYQIKGVVTENAVTSFFDESSINENEIRIGEDVYINSMQGLDQMLGYAVVAYMKQENDKVDGEIIYAYKDAKKNNEVSFMSEDINEATKTSIDYSVGNNSKKAKLSKSADVIYNGIGVDSYDAKTLQPTYGKLTLIDYDGDNVYDVVIVLDYKLVVVQSKTSTAKELGFYDKFGNDFMLDLDKVKCNISVYRKDAQAKLEEIVSGSVLLIADSGEKETTRKIDIYLSGDKVTGTLKGINEDEITIDSAVIPITPFMDVNTIKSYISKTVTCYTDVFGRAVYATVGGAGAYGFLFKISCLDGDMDDRIQIKILDTNNEWKTYLLKDKLKNNIDTVKDWEIFADATGQEEVVDVSKLNRGKATMKQLVRYELNADGEVSRMDLAATTASTGLNEDSLRENGYFRKSFGKVNRRFAHQISGLFVGTGYNRWLECFFPGDLPVLVRPDSDDIQEKDVLFYTKSYFKTDNDYLSEGYDLTEENYVSALVVYGDSKATIPLGERFVVVDKVVDELDADDMVVQKLYGWYQGTYTVFEAEDETAFTYKAGANTTKLQCGDIIRLAKNFSGKVESAEAGKMTFRIDGNPQAYFTDYASQDSNSSSAYGYNQLVIGTVGKVYGNYLRVTVQNGEHINILLRDAASYVLYDENNPKSKLSKGTKSDLTLGSVVVARLYFGRLDDVVIYKFR